MSNPDSLKSLQEIDTNCNDCKFMVRDFERYAAFDNLYRNDKGQVTRPSHRLNYGHCSKLNKKVSFIPNICNPDNAICFKHRKNN